MPSDFGDDREALTAWIDQVVGHWASIGMPRTERQRLRVDLERDLTEALEAGVPLSSLTAENPPAFAEQMASANGIPLAVRPPAILTNTSLITTGLVGGAVGAIFAWNFVYPLANRIPDFSGMSELMYAVIVHSVAATVVLSAALTAMCWRFRHDTTIGRTVAFAGPLMLLAGAASIAPTVAFASLSNYSTDPLVVLTEFTIVGGFVATALVLARRLARRPKQPPFGMQHRPAS